MSFVKVVGSSRCNRDINLAQKVMAVLYYSYTRFIHFAHTPFIFCTR